IYLEAGSGAGSTVPDAMVQSVSSYCSLPVIVGGGIDNLKEVKNKVSKGAKVIVMGNYFQDENNWDMLKDFADAVHIKKSVLV
ncbi:MAG: geranylgeranylglyceryl/heptaprenylglyceryl phosphate synthase, partial [Syntrophothermus sp.]